MENVFMNTANSKTTESNRFRLYFANKLPSRHKTSWGRPLKDLQGTYRGLSGDQYKN